MKTSLTLTQIIDEWLTNADVLPITKRSYIGKVGLWFRWLSANKIDTRHPVRSHVIAYKQSLELQRKSALTVDGYITAVKLFYKYCHLAGYCSDITLGVRCSNRYKGHRKSALTADQASYLIESFSNDVFIDVRDLLMVSLMLYAGLRVCEVERIDVGDIVTVDGSCALKLQRKGRREKSEMVALPSDVAVQIGRYLEMLPLGSDDPLFVSAIGRGIKRIKRTTMSKIVKQRLERIGINDPRITAHSLRHTCASIMVEQGVDIETIRDILGHTTTDTTRIYASEAQQKRLIRNSPTRHVVEAIKTAKNLRNG